MAKNILIVEDSAAQRFFLEKILKNEGYLVTSAVNGKQALEKIFEQKPDLILSDIVMPELDGFEFTRKLKNDPELQTIPVILMTTLNEPIEVLNIIECGADYLFLKEFEPNALTSFLKDVLANTSLSTALQPKEVLKNYYLGENRQITINNQQALNLLLSTYRSALHAYQRYYKFKFELNKIQKQLKQNISDAPKLEIPLLKSLVNELRTPINNLIHLTDLLKNTPDTEEREIQTQLAHLNTDHLLTILNDLQKTLDFKEKGQKIPVQKTTFSLRDCLEEAISPFTIQTGQKQVQIILHIEPQVPLQIKGDPNYLKHLTFSIVDLLLQHLKNCEIVINIQQSKHQTLHGIFSFPKNKALEKLFSQLEAENTNNEQTAIDFLKICQKKLNYQIHFKKSSNEQQQIEVLIPYPAAVQEKPVLSKQTKDLNPSSVRVLIYSEQWLSGLVMEELLQQWSFETKQINESKKIVPNLKQAHLAQKPYHLLLFDVHPENNTYFELIRQWHSSVDFPMPAIILLTPFGRPGDAKRCIESGVSAYLLKPIRSKDLKKALNAALNAPQKPTELITRHSLKEEQTQFHILIAEDNRVNQKLMVSILKRAGFEVELAVNGLEAVELFKQKKFDLVLMDMQMPIMDGFRATREIRKLEAKRKTNTPIFALTASDDEREIQGALNAGVNKVLRKPLNLKILNNEIRKHNQNSKVLPQTENVS